MPELVRTNDPSVLSVTEDLLTEEGIPYEVTDRHMSALEGGINAIQVRILVPAQFEAQARTLLADADLGDWLRD